MNIIADTILEQLGGMRFIAMTGMRQAAAGKAELQFKIPRSNGINCVRIYLEPSDTYEVTFYDIKRRGLNVDIVERLTGIYADQLAEVFTAQTGLETRL